MESPAQFGIWESSQPRAPAAGRRLVLCLQHHQQEVFQYFDEVWVEIKLASLAEQMPGSQPASAVMHGDTNGVCAVPAQETWE